MTWDEVIARIEAGPETRLAERGRISQVGELARATAIEFACYQRTIDANPPRECTVTSKVIICWKARDRWRSLVFHENGGVTRHIVELDPSDVKRSETRRAHAARA